MKMVSKFERKEIKYILTKKQHDDLLIALEGYMRPDKYGLTTICNIYFDTPNLRLVRESIEKPLYKEKLRLRTYGVPKDSDNAFIELKKKYEGIVYKRRETLPYGEAMRFLVGRERPERWGQIFAEIDWVLDFYKGLAPAMALFYERIAYEGLEDPELRLTLDNDVRFRTDDLDISHGSYGQELMGGDRYIMEIKILNAMPLWLADILDRLRIYPSSYSKYGSAYNKLLVEGEIQ
jgi:SPX domain protein involved in polyphosphate accumulation